MNPVYKAAKSAWKPADTRKAWEWCEEHVRVDRTSPFPGKWKSYNSPWVKDIMEDFQDNNVERITVQCSAQSAKTQTVLNCVQWCLSEEPGPAMYVLANGEDAEQFANERLVPSVRNCAPVKDQLESKRFAIKKGEINFKRATFYVVGAHSDARLQSKPIRWLFLDEVRNYRPGALSTALKRTRAFWNSRTFIITTPKAENDTCDREFKAGNQKTWHFECPHCQQLQTLDFFRLKWDVNEVTKPDGMYDFEELSKTIRYECPACLGTVLDEPKMRRHIMNKGRFVAMNPKAPKHRKSYTWNAMLPAWVKWSSLVEEYLEAKAAAKAGDLDPLKMFYTESLGLPWKETMIEFSDESALDSAKADYEMSDPWPEEQIRFMSADRQSKGGEHYWYVVRAFGQFGKSRLVAYGRAESKDQLETLRESYHVKAENSMIDSGHRSADVYRFCLAKRWKAFKGVPTESFTHVIKKKGRVIRVKRPYQKSLADPMIGMRRGSKTRGGRIPLYLMCGGAMKDRLEESILQLCGEWTIPERIGKDYIKQMTAEQKQEFKDSRGASKYVWVQVRADNHFWDCEQMILTAALIAKVITLPEVETYSKAV